MSVILIQSEYPNEKKLGKNVNFTKINFDKNSSNLFGLKQIFGTKVSLCFQMSLVLYQEQIFGLTMCESTFFSTSTNKLHLVGQFSWK